MNVVDPRTRSKVVLENGAGPARGSDLTQVAVSNVLYLLAFYLAKASLFDSGVLWLVVRILAVGAVASLAWGVFRGQRLTGKSVEWPAVGLAALLLSLRLCAVLFAVMRLPAIKVVIISQFSSIWMQGVINNISRPQALLILGPIGFSFMYDASFSAESLRYIAPGYLALTVEAISSSMLGHTQGVLLPTLGPLATNTFVTIGAFMLSLAAFMFTQFLPNAVSISGSTASFTMQSCTIGMLALALFFTTPALSKKLSYGSISREVALSYTTIVATATVFSVFPLLPTLGAMDCLVAGSLGYGISRTQSRESMSRSPYSSITQIARGYLKSILANPESRKIFYFLVLNMCYMLVQMLYGIWTNSLGLISDAIHMAFDCMAIGVGLIASVMARWAPNERFTYGYGRIETLSGFSNGIFLILISIFIVFEAIERLLNPPEMNTSQLLLVSTLGLGVNLFGMFAMGGHHHHGGHSHSHSHSHGHSHAPAPSKSPDHAHDHHGHSHSSESAPTSSSHSHSHSHGHSYEPIHSQLRVDTESRPSIQVTHSHSCDDEEHRDHDHSHDHSHQAKQLPDHPDYLKKSQLQSADIKSPITPNYNFEYDAHFEHHHASSHGPNLHDHTQIHDSVHEGHSHNMRGVFLHVMADTLGSVGVIISTLLIQFYGWTGFDPIASLFIAVLIAASVIPLVIDTGKVLMLDLDHRTSSVERALTELHQVDGVASYSSPRFWPKDDSNIIGSIHISVAPSASSHDPSGPHSTVNGRYQQVDRIVERVDTLLRSRISGLEELTIQVEAASV